MSLLYHTNIHLHYTSRTENNDSEKDVYRVISYFSLIIHFQMLLPVLNYMQVS
jgi:hypothetical protein